MSLELLLRAKSVEKHPHLMFFGGFLFSTIAMILSMQIFPRYASMVLISFTVIPLVPLFVKFIEDDEALYEKSKFLFRHHHTLKIYGFLFLGLVVSFSLWHTFLPQDISDKVFSEQLYTLYNLEGPLATYDVNAIPEGCEALSLLGYIDLSEYGASTAGCKEIDLDGDGMLEGIILLGEEKEPSLIVKQGEIFPYTSYIRNYIIKNNLMINFYIFITSFIFGAGALFVIVWNASLIGVFIGNSVRQAITSTSIFGSVSTYFTGFHISLGSLLLHGIPEFLAFFVAAVSGGILAVAFLKHGFTHKATKRVMKDALMLLGISVILVVVAGFLETL